MTEILEVTATQLNVRRSPAINPANIIGKLGQGEVVEKIGQPSSDWLEVRNSRLHGFASSRFFEPTTAAASSATSPVADTFVPPPATFPTNDRSQLTSTEQRHRPLGFAIRGPVAGQSVVARCSVLSSIVQLLDVERSARYLPTGPTYCNIYAYDYCHLAGVYLPRVWWRSKALLDLKAGGSPGVIYDTTVREMTANALFDWLSEWGDEFGWQRVSDANELQDAVNRGFVGVICAQRRDLSRSGHITVVVPEHEGHKAERVGTVVVRPLQSQAGARNKAYFTNQWWIDLDSQFRAHGFWVHPGIAAAANAAAVAPMPPAATPRGAQTMTTNPSKLGEFWLGIPGGSRMAIEVTGSDDTHLITASGKQAREDGVADTFSVQTPAVRTFERRHGYVIQVDISFVTAGSARVVANVTGPDGEPIQPAFDSKIERMAGAVVPVHFFVTTL